MKAMLAAALTIATLLLGQPAAAKDDSCSSHAANCHKLCPEKLDLKGKCAAACDQRLDQCKQTGIYTDATGIKHTVTSRD